MPASPLVFLKAMMRRIVRTALANELVWAAIRSTGLAHPAHYLSVQREVAKEERFARWAKRLAAAGRVARGPFAGLSYPEATAKGSELAPKFLGSYESELHALIEALCTRPWTQVVNIGCGEGYYAVGLARRLPSAKIIASDTDPSARELCRRMAACNNTVSQVTVTDALDSARLALIVAGRPALVLSDCEGYEIDLFDNTSIPALQAAHLIIETHDFIRPAATPTLKARFAASHLCMEIPALTPEEKAAIFIAPEIPLRPTWLRPRALSENRPQDMRWLYLQPVGPAS